MWTGNQVTVSMRVMSAGTGYRYLLKSVVAADGDRALSTPLTRYYTQTGTPPGFWLGSGVNGLGDGALQPGDEVTEDQLRLLMGEGRDPVTGAALGRAFPEYKSRAERIRIRVDALNPWMPEAERITAVAAIEAEESDRRVRRAVAGFDFTFSAPKSVSVLWGLVDPDTRTAVVAAHHAAVADVIGLMEREVAATRTGAASTDGAVAQVAVEGLIATAYDHFDSRAGDPQLHTHVVISNKVKTVLDRKWRSLDGRPLHASVVAMSELYNSVLADHLSRSLGVQWEARERGRDRNPAWEIAGIPHELIDLFSSRSHAIEVEIAQLVADYRERHGSGPAPATMIKLREQATLATRPYKNMRPLDELTRSWRATAKPVLSQFSAALRAVMGAGGNQRADGVSGVLGWVRDGVRTSPFPSQGRQLVSAEDLLEPVIDRFGQRVVQTVGDKRSTWRRWNLHAEASRQTMGLRFASTADRETVIGRIVAAAEGASVRLTPPDLASIPAQFRRPDGSSVFRPKHSTVFTSAGLLAAEDRLLQLGRATGGVTVPIRNLDFAARGANRPGVDLSDDQVAALIAVGTSGRALDVLVGPAGAGKTTAMQALRSAWELTHGPGSVIGLAPSAAAAQLLADDLGIATENTAKWLHDHTTTGQYFLSSQLVIIDEASLAGTHTLDQITSRAATVGAKVLLVGDWAQLAAINAGGAFGLLVRDRDEPPELTDVHRFHHDWEKRASLLLRNGDTDVIDTYQTHGRIHEGDTEATLDTIYRAWREDRAFGRSSLMIAQTHKTVAALNTRARQDRVQAGHVDPAKTARLHDHTVASVGDVVITRRNNRRLQAGHGWVKNGDRWTITTIHNDASITARRENPIGPAVRLPAEYVAEHVELGYAVTAHRAQGVTVDTAHVLADPGMTRETLYVAMTRGRHANTAYVMTDHPDTEPHQQADTNPVNARSILHGIVSRSSAEQSAHQAIRSEQQHWTTIAQLAAEYETIAAAAQHDRWTTFIHDSGLTKAQADAVVTSDAFGPLTAALRRTEAHHHDVTHLLPQLVAAAPVRDAHDIASVLHYRLAKFLAQRNNTTRPLPPQLIAGLIPQAVGPMTTEMRKALDQRKSLIDHRATRLLEQMLIDNEPWIRSLREPPQDPRHRQDWLVDVRTIAAYRDRHQITTDGPLGRPDRGPSEATGAAYAGAGLSRVRRRQQASVDDEHLRRHAARPPNRSM